MEGCEGLTFEVALISALVWRRDIEVLMLPTRIDSPCKKFLCLQPSLLILMSQCRLEQDTKCGDMLFSEALHAHVHKLIELFLDIVPSALI